MSPNTVIGILNYKKQLDQDNAARAAEAQANLPETRPRTTGTYGPLANAVSANISGDQVPVTPMANPPVAGGVAKSSYDEPASEIQQYPDLPSAPVRPQLDASNLASAVPTNLTPPPGYGQRPRLVTGMPVEEGAAPPIGYNGGQLINAQDRAYLNPRVPDPNLTYEGTPRPQLQTYDNSTDVSGKHIGRWGRFSAGAEKGVAGGPINALIGGVLGLANPHFGNRAAYQRDIGEFESEKQANQAQDARDPYYQNQLQSQQLRMDQPVKLQTYQAQQQAELARQTQLAAVNNNARAANVKANNDAKFARLTQADQDKVSKQGDTYASQILANDQTGMMTPELAKHLGNAKALADEDAKRDKTQAQANLANSRSDNLDEITKNLPQKFKDAHSKVEGYLANVQTNKDRLALQQGNATQRAENERQLRQGNALQSELNTLEADHKAQYAVINNPYNSTPDKQPLVDAARKRIADIDGRINEINSQRLDTAGAPGKGQKATRPGAKAPAASTPPAGKIPIFNSDGTFTGRYK